MNWSVFQSASMNLISVVVKSQCFDPSKIKVNVTITLYRLLCLCV